MTIFFVMEQVNTYMNFINECLNLAVYRQDGNGFKLEPERRPKVFRIYPRVFYKIGKNWLWLFVSLKAIWHSSQCCNYSSMSVWHRNDRQDEGLNGLSEVIFTTV